MGLIMVVIEMEKPRTCKKCHLRLVDYSDISQPARHKCVAADDWFDSEPPASHVVRWCPLIEVKRSEPFMLHGGGMSTPFYVEVKHDD